MKKIIGIIVVFSVVFLTVLFETSFAEESHWGKKCSNGFSCEVTYETFIGNTYCCIVVLNEDGGIEAGAKKKEDEYKILSYVLISNSGKLEKISSISIPISEPITSYYHSDEPGRNIFTKECYNSAIESEDIPSEVREKIKKALNPEQLFKQVSAQAK